MQQLGFYFRGRMRAANSILNEARVVANLHKVQNIRTQAELLVGEGLSAGQRGRNRHVTVSEERVCRVCHKRLGGSVISVFPEYVIPFRFPKVRMLLTTGKVIALFILDVRIA